MLKYPNLCHQHDPHLKEWKWQLLKVFGDGNDAAHAVAQHTYGD